MVTDTVTCIHYWRISRANGPWSQGVCHRCGARKEFSNSAPEASAFTNAAGKRGRPKKEKDETQ